MKFALCLYCSRALILLIGTISLLAMAQASPTIENAADSGLIFPRGAAGDCYNPVSTNCQGQKTDIGLNTPFKCSSMQINGGKFLCSSCDEPISKCKRISAYNCHANIEGCIKSN